MYAEHFTKSNVRFALQKYIFALPLFSLRENTAAPNAFVTFYFALHFPKKMFSNAKKKGKSKKESIFTSAIFTFYQVKTKYYVFCEQNAEVCINIGF